MAFDLETKCEILQRALLDACKVLRERPVEMDWYLEDTARLTILCNGVARDPEGKEFFSYFVNHAWDKIKKEREANETNSDDSNEDSRGELSKEETTACD